MSSSGVDSFTYAATDSSEVGNVATVVINVQQTVSGSGPQKFFRSGYCPVSKPYRDGEQTADAV